MTLSNWDNFKTTYKLCYLTIGNKQWNMAVLRLFSEKTVTKVALEWGEAANQ